MSPDLEIDSTQQPTKQTGSHYRLLVESVTDYAIFLLDPTGHVATWNTGAKRIKQYEAKEIIGKHFSTFYSAEAKANEYPAYELKEAKARGRFEDEGWRIRKDGSAFWANVIITPLYNYSNEFIGFSKITRDLSERKKAEDDLLKAYEELKESEEKYRLLVEGVTDYAIFMLDPAGNVATWNQGARKIKGYESHEIIGKYFSKFYDREAIQKGFPEHELKMARAKGRFEDEGWRHRKDGSAFWANVVITAIYNSKNEFIGFSKITRDLTERRRNEDLMQKNQELIRINNDLDNFVYTASHDLKSPITNLEGLLIALQEDLGNEREKHEGVISMMNNAIVTLKKVITDLADVNQLQQDKEKLEAVHIPGLIEEVKENLRELITNSQAQISVDVSDLQTLTYARKNLRSILHNLISNAIKYAAPERTPEVSIKTSLSSLGELKLSVSDNGLGIPEHQIDKIFALYKRVHDHVEGSGIGLYLVKKILNNAGDRIVVESEVGKGTTFHVYFRQN